MANFSGCMCNVCVLCIVYTTAQNGWLFFAPAPVLLSFDCCFGNAFALYRYSADTDLLFTFARRRFTVEPGRQAMPLCDAETTDH